jgi:Icc-related predicted phosphoesterase
LKDEGYRMIIDCISDLHGYYPELEGGDLLIVAGDLTARDEPKQYLKYFKWISEQNYKKIVWISGNHDNCLDKYEILESIVNSDDFPKERYAESIEYLCDSGTEFEGLRIWGSPWTLKFPGINPHCMAFTCDTEEELAEKWDKIPNDLDILVTHSPPFGILDKNVKGEHCGSVSLRNKTLDGNYFKKFRHHIFGHIHEMGSYRLDLGITKFINCSHVNEYYQPVNQPVRIEL